MYSKKFRLPIDKKKKRWAENFSSPYFLLKAEENKKGHNRFGIIISNHAVKSSARRHFWKRTISDELQKMPDTGKDFLVIVSTKIETTGKKALSEEFGKILKKYR